MDFGIIGNCQYSALIDKQSRITWLCWPRFDSSPIFGSLLDEQLGEFTITAGEDQQTKQHYLQNTNILRTEFVTPRGSFEVIDFAPRFVNYNRIFNPTMLVRIVRPITGESFIRVRCQPTYDYGDTKPTLSWGSNHIHFGGFANNVRLTTNAPRTYIQEEKPFALSDTKYFVLTWGSPLEAPLADTAETFFHNTKKYWQTWVKHCRIPRDYQEEVIRSALVLKLHQFEDTGAIIAATTTSLPEIDQGGRNWDYRHCWLRDAYFTLSAFESLGQFEEMERFVAYLRNIVEESNEHLQPVYGISSEKNIEEKILKQLKGFHNNTPVRIGNAAYTHKQHDIYGEMILATKLLFIDRRFVIEGERVPISLLQKLVDRIEKYLSEKDAGIWEFRSTEQVHSFSLLMHWAGAKTAQEIATKCQEQDIADKAFKLKELAHSWIQKCWSKKLGCYTEAVGTEVVDASLFMMANLGYLTKDNPQATEHIKTLSSELAAPNNLIYRYKHADDFGTPVNAFIVCSFWHCEALSRLGKAAEAKELFSHLLSLKNHLGLYSEHIDPKTLKLWGNFPQTYSHVGLINAAFRIADES